MLVGWGGSLSITIQNKAWASTRVVVINELSFQVADF